jgi:hypothetical protein
MILFKYAMKRRESRDEKNGLGINFISLLDGLAGAIRRCASYLGRQVIKR